MKNVVVPILAGGIIPLDLEKFTLNGYRAFEFVCKYG